MKKMSTLDLRTRINQLNRLDLTKADFDTLVTSIRKMSIGLSWPIDMSSVQEKYFRVRTNTKERPSLVSELGALPKECVQGFQRCNQPFNSVFYAATDRGTALLESRVEVGDKVYLGHWAPRGPLPFNRIFDIADSDLDAAFPDQSAAATALYTFFDSQFTRKIHSSFSDDYKLTAAIAAHLMEGLPPNPKFDIRDDRTIGLRYPSAIATGHATNVAFKSSFVAERIDLIHVSEIVVKDIQSDKITYEICDNSNEFENDEIIWSGDPCKMETLAAGEHLVSFFADNGQTEWTFPIGKPYGPPRQLDPFRGFNFETGAYNS